MTQTTASPDTDEETLTAAQVAAKLGLATRTIMDYYREGILRPFLSDKKSPRFSWEWVKEDLKKLNRR